MNTDRPSDGSHRPVQPAEGLLDLAEAVVSAESVEKLVERALPTVAAALSGSNCWLYLAGQPWEAPRWFEYRLPAGLREKVEEACRLHWNDVAAVPERDRPEFGAFSITSDREVQVRYHPLCSAGQVVGLVGYAEPIAGECWPSEAQARMLRLLARGLERLRRQGQLERQLRYLNTYLSVSSMLAQYLGLHESLEIALYCCMEAVSAEAGSVLLLDEEKQNFRFYHVEGPAKPVLAEKTFPADKGLAGHVLRTQQAEVVNDVQHDPRFWRQIDSESGFRTRNLIAVPLTAGEEQIGVLEILNKSGGEPFTDDERLLLQSVAEEIAFAIRNAMIFEYVVNSYCKQRQGQSSCRGCRRPLRSWTPCVRYREAIA